VLLSEDGADHLDRFPADAVEDAAHRLLWMMQRTKSDDVAEVLQLLHFDLAEYAVQRECQRAVDVAERLTQVRVWRVDE
jgi:hypothetical protein